MAENGPGEVSAAEEVDRLIAEVSPEEMKGPPRGLTEPSALPADEIQPVLSPEDQGEKHKMKDMVRGLTETPAPPTTDETQPADQVEKHHTHHPHTSAHTMEDIVQQERMLLRARKKLHNKDTWGSGGKH